MFDYLKHINLLLKSNHISVIECEMSYKVFQYE